MKMREDFSRHITCTPDILSGAPHIVGRRIGVHHIIQWRDKQKWSLAKIAQDFDLSPTVIQAALIYYEHHKQAIDTYLANEERLSNNLQAEQKDNPRIQALKRKMAAFKVQATKQVEEPVSLIA